MSDMFGVSTAMGLVNAGIQTAGKMAQERLGKKVQSTNRRMQKRDRASQMRELDLAGRETQRQFGDAQSNVNAEAAGAGDETSANFYSTNRQYQQGQLGDERNRRLAALERQKTLLQGQWHDEDKIYKAQKKMARMQKYLDMANSLLSSGASGMGGYAQQ